MKDIKHIRCDFHLVTWVIAQGWELGVLGGGGWCQQFKLSEHVHVAYQIKEGDKGTRIH